MTHITSLFINGCPFQLRHSTPTGLCDGQPRNPRAHIPVPQKRKILRQCGGPMSTCFLVEGLRIIKLKASTHRPRQKLRGLAMEMLMS
jgi:hypothetical protein